MNLRTSVFPATCLVLALATGATAQLAPHRARVDLQISPSPIEGSPRNEDLLFDRQARLTLHLVNLADPAPNIRVQFIWVHDDVTTGGKIKRQYGAQELSLGMERGSTTNVVSDPIRLTGKINRKGVLSGMRHIGYGVRVWNSAQDPQPVFATVQPPTLKEELNRLIPFALPVEKPGDEPPDHSHSSKHRPARSSAPPQH